MFDRSPKPKTQSRPARSSAHRAVPRTLEDAASAVPPPRFSLHDLPILPPGGDALPAQLRPAPHPNRTGLPDRLKAGVEALSGMALDHVRVRYRSPEPARIGALAYARGHEIHVGPGQEHHLPHEAWHIVQQAQGRVRPQGRLVDGGRVNDESALEGEAERVGASAWQARPGQDRMTSATPRPSIPVLQPYWEKQSDGNVMWIEGAPPNTVRKIGTHNNKPLYEVGVKSRSEINHIDKNKIIKIPKLLTREDSNFTAKSNPRGGRKAYLIKQGLAPAGYHPITAMEHLDSESRNKGMSNRISAKGPLAPRLKDNSQGYGGQQIGIKARKLVIANKRGKPDAQHLLLH